MALFSLPLPGTLPMTFKMLVAILIPSIIITVLAGPTHWAVAVLIMVLALLFPASSRRWAGLLSLTPIIILFAPGVVELSWWEAGVRVITGGVAGGRITRMLKFQAPVRPVKVFVAWEHGIAVDVLCVAVMYWILASNIPHSYWIAVTVLMALRPLPEERRDTLNGRLVGTFLGAIIALLAFVFLPLWGALVVAALSMFFLIWHTLGGAYVMQALTLAPMLLIFSSLGDLDRGFDLTAERVGFTIVGIAAAIVVALVLRRWEQRRQSRKGLAA